MPRASARLIGWILATVMVVVAVWSPSAGAAAFPNDREYPRQWYIRRIGAPEAWKTTQGKGITVAVVDSGVNYQHEDLRGNLLLNKQYDTINNDGDAMDFQGHGSGVAGVVAAVTNNKKGIAGVAPKAKIMAVRVATTDERWMADDVSEGIRWAADNGAQVMNLSLGSPTLPLSTLEPDILYAAAKGVLIVVAAGNESLRYCTSPGFNPAVLCVGATDSLDRLAGFSNYALRLDVTAPGEGIYTTTTLIQNRLIPTGYSSVNGTSFAAPIVSGIGALLMSMGANSLTAGLIIRATTKDLGLPGYDLTYGFGRVDAKAAVALCKQIC